MFYFVHSFHLRLVIIVVFTFIHSWNHHSLKKNKYSEYWDSDYSCVSYHHTSSPWGPSIMKFELQSYCRNSSGGLSQATLMLTPRKALANGARTSRKRKSTSRRTSACLYSLTGLGKLVCVQAINSSTTFFTKALQTGYPPPISKKTRVPLRPKSILTVLHRYLLFN